MSIDKKVFGALKKYVDDKFRSVQSGNLTVERTPNSILFVTNKGEATETRAEFTQDELRGLGIKDVKLKTVIEEGTEETHLLCILDNGTEIDAGKFITKEGTTDYEALTNKPSINGVKLTGDKSLSDLGINEYDDTEIKKSISEVSNGLMDSVGYSADYKTIDIIAKNGVKKSVDVKPVISHAKITELSDVDKTNIGSGKTLIYDEATGKHKYIDVSGTDELVKLTSDTEAKYLEEFIDKVTIKNEGGVLKTKKLDGQEVSIEEINYLKGLTMNVMDLVNMFSNGGVKIINTPVNTYAELLNYDKSSLIEGISYIIYVLNDETHDNVKTTYLIDKDTATPSYFGFAGEYRDFSTSPINLANEVTGKLDNSHIDVDALWSLLTINNTYKTLTVNNEVFGTHGAKALYDEMVSSISSKANQSDLESHTNDTDIHTSATEKASYVKKTDITTTIDSTSTDTQVPSAKSAYNATNKFLKTYTSIEQLGLTKGSETIEDIANSMEDRTRLITIIFESDHNTSIYPYCNGTLIVEKINIYRVNLKFCEDISNNVYVSTYHGEKGFTGWKRLCTTSVADVPITTITDNLVSTKVAFQATDSNAYLYVKNGTCYVSIWDVTILEEANLEVLFNNAPKPAFMVGCSLHNGYESFGHVFVTTNSTEIRLNAPSGLAGKSGYCSFSYPVSES